MTTKVPAFSPAWRSVRWCLGWVTGLGVTSMAMAQYGYQPQEPHTSRTSNNMPGAYAQQSFIPPAGAGVQQGYGAPAYQPQTATGYAPKPASRKAAPKQQTYAPAPQAYQPQPMTPAYQQQGYPQQAYQPQGQQQQAYQPQTQQYQAPAMPSYPAYGGQQPMPYPQSGGLSPLNGAPRPTSKKAANLNHPTMEGSMSSQVAALRANDRSQDRRLSDLERHAFPAAAGKDHGAPTTGQHTVAIGDSLSSIASRYRVSVDELKRINRHPSNVIMAGEVLTVPARGSKGQYQPPRMNDGRTPSSPKSSQSGTHIVQSGESLSAIAASYRVSMKSLQEANGIRNANLISSGQRLKIPGKASFASAPQVKTTTSNKQYVSSPPKPARPKETLLVADVPAAGSGLGAVIAPTGPRGVTSYRVEQGDTMESVAQNFASTPSEIQRINKLGAPHLPAVGEEIVVPLPGSVSL